MSELRKCEKCNHDTMALTRIVKGRHRFTCSHCGASKTVATPLGIAIFVLAAAVVMPGIALMQGHSLTTMPTGVYVGALALLAWATFDGVMLARFRKSHPRVA